MATRSASSEYFDEGETIPAPALAADRWKALAAVVDHADRALPFYRSLWSAADFAPSATIDEVAFRRVPIVRKRDLVGATRERRSMLIGAEALAGFAPRFAVMTSGTMGFNTFALLTNHELDGTSTLVQARELWSMKVRPGMRALSLSPAWHPLGLQESRAITAIGAVPVLPWGTLTPRFARDILTAVTSLRPEHVLVTARALRMLLHECERIALDPRVAFASVRYVGCAGEALSPAFRRYLVDRLDVEDVFERGGSSDGMFGGGECFAHRGHHISADAHYIEVVDSTTGESLPAGRRGTAVVTNLTLGKSLYIRFDTEDVAEIVPGDCPCGRTHPVVELYGRLADSVTLPGRIISPADVRCVLDELEATRFRPFSMTWDRRLVVTIEGGVSETGRRRSGVVRSEVEETLEARLSVPVSVAAGEIGSAGWKEERIRREPDERVSSKIDERVRRENDR